MYSCVPPGIGLGIDVGFI